MKIKTNNKAVAEIVGSVLLLAIAVAVFSVIYAQVLSDPGPSPETYVTLVGKMESKDGITTVAFENRRGETLGNDTNIILKIGGSYGFTKSVTIEELNAYYSSSNNFLENGWNIGDKIHPLSIFSSEFGNLKDVAVDATIVDKKSNSIVFWGRLQEGYEVPPFGRGGIWHFDDEPFWDGTEGEVKDSSGNNNHGTAKNGAYNTDSTAVSGRAGFFDEVDDYVEIPSSFSLDITQEITVEAYIKPLVGTGVLNWGDFYSEFFLRPNILKISQLNEINYTCAVVGQEKRGNDENGVLNTVKINTVNGTITPISIGNVFGAAPGAQQGQLWAKIVHVTDDLYAIVYENDQLKITIKTINISNIGSVTPIYKPEFIYDSGSEPDIIYVGPYLDTDAYVFAITYQNGAGYIGTVKITPDGTVTALHHPAHQFDSSGNCGKPKIINVSCPDDDNFYIFTITYQKGAGYLKTIKIKNDGQVLDSGWPGVPFATKCDEPDMVYVSGPIDNEYIFAVAYSENNPSTTPGYIQTVRIRDDGKVFDPDISRHRFASEGYTPDIIHTLNDIYVVAYTDGNNAGYFKTISIQSDGSVSDTEDLAVRFSRDPPEKYGKTPDIIKLTPAVFAVAYEDQAAKPGTIATLRIYKDSTPPHLRGIVKFGAAQLHANDTHVYASINGADHNLTLPINCGQWNYIVLTYNRSVFRLYCNYDKDTSNQYGINWNESLDYTQPINLNPNDLRFGHKFYGYLDEIAIYDRAFEEDEIKNNYGNPDFFIKTLEVSISPMDKGLVSADPVSPYYYNDVVTLTPIPITGWKFDHWSGLNAGDLVDNGHGTWSITMNENKALTVIFAEDDSTYEIVALTSGSGTWTVPDGVTSIDVLVVAGGGGAGYADSEDKYKSGAGGAGGLIWVQGVTQLGTINIVPGNTISYSIGSGGAGSNDKNNEGAIGGDTTFGILAAKGGGGGGSSNKVNGLAGGSGGGAGVKNNGPGIGGTQTQTAQSGWSGVFGFGHNGANADSSYGGGGGGANAAGTEYTGGAGKDMSYFFRTTYGVSGVFAKGGNAESDGTSGTINTGNGGNALPTGSGGAGGSGIILIRYQV